MAKSEIKSTSLFENDSKKEILLLKYHRLLRLFCSPRWKFKLKRRKGFFRGVYNLGDQSKKKS
jgi:hypothetical protein